MKKEKNMKISPILTLQKSQMTAGLSAYDVRHTDFAELSDPVISMTHFFMSQPTFPPHPHAGFSAITYMLETSANGFYNRDSLGNESPIHPGDLHWTMAGRGVMHEEVPLRNGIPAEGLQIFINLKERNKMIAPRAFHVTSAEAPCLKDEGLTIKVVSGSYGQAAAAFQPPEPVQILDIKVQGDGALKVGENQGGLIYAYQGALQFETDAGWRPLQQHQTFAFHTEEAGSLNLKAAAEARLILLSGTPIHEPVIARGPFIMTSYEALRDAERRFRAGEMGLLE